MKSQIARSPSIPRRDAEAKHDGEPLGGLAPINRDSVEQRAAQALRDLIVSDRLPQGTPLVQRELAHRLGISQTPIRLALIELERAGLVEIRDNGRALVRRLTREDLEELYAARLGLEGLAARLGAVAVGPAELARMAELLAGLDRLAREQSLEAYLEGRWAFHSTAYVASRRMRLVAEVERLFWRGGRYHRLVLSSPERFRRSVRSYHDFLAACRKHDPDRAERVIHDSMRWAVDLVAPSLPSEQELR